MDKYENYELTDEQWRRIQPMLPPEYTGKKGRPKKDNRMMVNGMLWMNRSGAQWRQLPKRYGPWQSVYARFAKWRDDGILEYIFSELNQEADTGTKMIHLGRNTKSTIISKGISAGKSQNSYRGLVRVGAKADNARNYSSCDSLLLGSDCGAHTFPYMDVHNDTAIVEHEATTSKISEDQLFYCNQRGIPTEQAVGLIVNGYAKEVLNKLPMEFAVEAQKLLSVSLEGTVG